MRAWLIGLVALVVGVVGMIIFADEFERDALREEMDL